MQHPAQKRQDMTAFRYTAPMAIFFLHFYPFIQIKEATIGAGPLKNRFRIVGGVLKAVRKTVGKDYPVLIKLNTYEKASDGMNSEECALISKMVEETDCCDAIELSCGTSEDGFVMARGEFPTDAIF